MHLKNNIEETHLTADIKDISILSDMGHFNISANIDDIFESDEPVPVDPIQVLVDEYKAAATTKGYTYLGDDAVLYAKYEELVTSNKLNSDIYLASPKYACNIVDGNVTKCLSLVKILGDYPEFVNTGDVQYNDEFFRFDRTTEVFEDLRCVFSRNYNKSSFRIKYRGSVDLTSAANTRIWTFNNVQGLKPVYLRKISNTQIRYAFYNEAGALLTSRTLTLDVDTNHTHEDEFIRSGNNITHKTYRNGVMQGTDFAVTGSDNVLNSEGIRIGGSWTNPARMSINEFEIELYLDNQD